MLLKILLVASLTGFGCAGNSKAGAVDQSGSSKNPEVAFVKAGTFDMGISGGEFDEGPVHKVSLSDYYIGKFEVTVAQYKRFALETGRPMPKQPDWGGKPDEPVVNVTWTDASDFAKWLSEESGEKYRLPTEAEWYFVATDGGKTITYPWGEGNPSANIADETAAKKWASKYWKGTDDGFAYLAPVGSFDGNSLGVHDMGGNAAEWVSNFHYEFSAEKQDDPLGPKKGKNKVFKGGSFRTNAWYSRIAQRNFMPVTFKQDYLGFRIVKQPKTQTD
ncbi:MAG: SUMF1/EgtB/PvdO family nonheme iron enzyme [Pyrinomonadaceae bacterium]|nr:SUMF1/EgtB/PvdO family nonheme iron enzyme [Pyrinomonadaceae bacterium]